MLVSRAKIQYIFMLVHGEALRHIYNVSAEVGNTISENLKYIILGLFIYYLLLMHCQNKSGQ